MRDLRTAFLSLPERFVLLRLSLRWRFARLRRGLLYGVDRLSTDDAQEARETFQDHPALPRLVNDAHERATASSSGRRPASGAKANEKIRKRRHAPCASAAARVRRKRPGQGPPLPRRPRRGLRFGDLQEDMEETWPATT
jgi:hypothetical protein